MDAPPPLTYAMTALQAAATADQGKYIPPETKWMQAASLPLCGRTCVTMSTFHCSNYTAFE